MLFCMLHVKVSTPLTLHAFGSDETGNAARYMNQSNNTRGGFRHIATVVPRPTVAAGC